MLLSPAILMRFFMQNILEIRSAEFAAMKRAEIKEQLFKVSPNIKSFEITCISGEDLRLLFMLYDQVFFDNWFLKNYKGKMKFSLSGKMTKSAGKTLCPRNIRNISQESLVIEIRIGVDFFLNYGRMAQSNEVCGLRVTNSLDALLLVFEHEFCHVIEFLMFKTSSCSGKRFKLIAANLFGHKESYHKLPTDSQVAGKLMGLKAGMQVAFVHKDKRLTGIVYRINKRATVLVKDKNGAFADKKGTRYAKYYVPLSLLSVQQRS